MANVVQDLSNGLANAVEAVKHAVVRVEGRRRLPASGIMWPDGGIVITAHHVLERDESIKVGISEGKSLEAQLIGRDPSTDLAVLRVEDAGRSSVAWKTVEGLRVGHLVLALGRPTHEVQATLGIVSALETDRKTPLGGSLRPYLQTDVVMYPGFSGGPLVDVEGNILGVNTSVFRGVSVAISTPIVRSVTEALLAHGRIRRGYIGVGLQPVKIPEGLADDVDQEFGLLVTGVEPGSPAAEGGITLGDTLLTFDSEPIVRIDDLHRSLAGDLIGKSVVIGILRGGERFDRELVVGERP